MALIDDVLAAQAAEDQDIKDAADRVAATITDLTDQIAALVAAGSGATPEQLQAILGTIQGERAAIEAIDALPPAASGGETS